MADQIEVTLPELSSAQELAFASSARFNIVHGGNDAGKSTLAAMVLLVSHFGALNGFHTALFVPNDEAVTTAKRAIFSRIQPLIVGPLNRTRIELVNGGSIRFVAMDKSLELWDPLNLIVVDNAGKTDRLDHIHDDIIDPLLDLYRGHAWYLGKPAGTRNSFARMAARADTDDRWARFQLKATDNQYADQDEVEWDRANLSLDAFRQERLGEFVESTIDLTPSQTIIKPNETFLQWCERLAKDGLKVDSKPFRLDNRQAMHFIYDLIPNTIKEAYQRIDVIMKCTQVGFSVMEMLAMIYLGLRFPASKIGMFMPSKDLASGKSANRFMDIVRTVPAVYAIMKDGVAETGQSGEGNVLTRNLGDSRYHFLWTSGKTATESNPMDIVSFDEVQEMEVADMEKTRERMSASIIRYTLMGSTAKYPDNDIHWWWKKGTKHQFHTECQHCHLLQILDEHFPECIKYDPTAPRLNEREREAGMVGEYRYKCHGCDGWIDDTQIGVWIPQDPEATIRSVHFPQTLSPTISAREMIEAFHNAMDMQNFYNRKLGKPYVDPSKVPVSMDMLAECVEEGKRFNVVWKDRAKDTFAGIDQMGAFNVILIAERLPSGHMALIHAEEIYDLDPFARCSVLLAQYGVRVCVVETLPNYNDAKRFANKHKGIVFLAGYAEIRDDMLRWGDSVPSKLDRKTDEEERDRCTVTLDQYKCMQVALKRIAEKVTIFADPKGLLQMLSDDGDNGIRGEKQLAPILERVFKHFTRTALIAEKDDEQNKYKRKVIKVGIDPHFSYAFMLLNVAWSRAFGGTSFLFDETLDKDSLVEIGQGAVNSPVLNTLLNETAEIGLDKCGGCASFDASRNLCEERQLLVRVNDAACFMFMKA